MFSAGARGRVSFNGHHDRRLPKPAIVGYVAVAWQRRTLSMALSLYPGSPEAGGRARLLAEEFGLDAVLTTLTERHPSGDWLHYLVRELCQTADSTHLSR